RADLLDAAVDLILDALLAPAQDVEVKRLLGLHLLGRVRGALARVDLALGLEVRDEALERIVTAVENEVIRELALALTDLGVGRDVVGVDHREIEPRVNAVVQEDGVEDRTRAGGNAERDVR